MGAKHSLECLPEKPEKVGSTTGYIIIRIKSRGQTLSKMEVRSQLKTGCGRAFFMSKNTQPNRVKMGQENSNSASQNPVKGGLAEIMEITEQEHKESEVIANNATSEEVADDVELESNETEQEVAAEAIDVDAGDEVDPEDKDSKKANPLTSLEGDEKEAKIKELLEAEEVSDDEMAFLKENGHEVAFEGEDEDQEDSEAEAKKKVEEEEEAKKKEELENTRPEFADEIDSIFPDREFKNREEYDKAVIEHLNNEAQANQQLLGAFEENPELQAVVKDMTQNGKSFLEALHAHVDIDSLNVQPGDENYEEVVRAKVNRENQKKEQEKRIQELRSNQEKTIANSVEFVKEHKLTKADESTFFNQIDKIISDLNNGLVSKETFEVFKKGMAYEKDVKSAKEVGEIAGKNTAVIIKKKKLKGDAMPKVNAPKSKPKEQPKVEYADPIAEMLDKMIHS